MNKKQKGIKYFSSLGMLILRIFIICMIILSVIVGVVIVLIPDVKNLMLSENGLGFIQLFTDITTIVGVFIAVLTLIASNEATNDTKSIAKGEFVHNLHDEFSNNEYGPRIFEMCWNEYCGNKVDWTTVDNEDIVKYLTFFETLYFMLDKEILKIEELDDLFRRRFFVVVNNAYIQNTELVGKKDDEKSEKKEPECFQKYKYYKNIYRLHSKWKDYDQENDDLFVEQQDLEDALCAELGDKDSFYQEIYGNKKEAKKEAKKKK